MRTVMPGADPIQVINAALPFYFVFDFFIRLLLQKFPSVLLLAYLALPLRRRFLVGYILGKWHIDFLNLIFISDTVRL